MPKFMVEYFTESEALHQTFLEAPSELIIPFRLRDCGVKDLKRVKLATRISDEEYAKAVAPVQVEPQPAELAAVPQEELDQLRNKIVAAAGLPPAILQDTYEPSPDRIFIKNGVIGRQYVIGGSVYELVKISEFSVRVRVGGKLDWIAPNAEAVPFDMAKHGKLLNKKEDAE